MDLDRCNYRQVAQYLEQKDSVVLGVGAIEQHGPGCSLGTDARIPDVISRRLADEFQLMRVPTLYCGVSTDHLRFPGTISLKPATLAAVFADVFSSLYGHGFRRFFVVNGHFDNAHCIKGEVLTLLHRHAGALVYFRDFWEFDCVRAIMRERLGEEGGHGDATDVAIMMHLSQEEVVPNDLVEEWPEVSAFLSYDLQDRYVTKAGVIGSNQRKATPEIGAELFQAIMSAYRKDITDLLKVDLNINKE